MSDIFLEKIVQRRKTGIDYLKIIGLLIATVIILMLLMIFSPYVAFLLPVLLVGTFYGLWWLLTSMNREYEYIVTNGDLDIDMIIARRRRKRVFSANARSFEIMAPLQSDEYKDARRGQITVLDATSHVNAPDNWFLIADYKGNRTLVLFAPDERMLKNLKRFNPSKIRYNMIGGAN